MYRNLEACNPQENSGALKSHLVISMTKYNYTCFHRQLFGYESFGGEFPPKKKALEETLFLCAFNNKISYRISSVRCHGYYFFLLLIIVQLLFECSYYSRAAFISLENLQTSTTAG